MSIPLSNPVRQLTDSGTSIILAAEDLGAYTECTNGASDVTVTVNTGVAVEGCSTTFTQTGGFDMLLAGTATKVNRNGTAGSNVTLVYVGSNTYHIYWAT